MSGEPRADLARLLLRDRDAPPVAVIAAYRSLFLGDHARLDDLIRRAARVLPANQRAEESND